MVKKHDYTEAKTLLYNGCSPKRISDKLGIRLSTLISGLGKELNTTKVADICYGARARIVSFFCGSLGKSYRQLAKELNVDNKILGHYKDREPNGAPEIEIELKENVKDFQNNTIKMGQYKCRVINSHFILVNLPELGQDTLICRTNLTSTNIVVTKNYIYG